MATDIALIILTFVRFIETSPGTQSDDGHFRETNPNQPLVFQTISLVTRRGYTRLFRTAFTFDRNACVGKLQKTTSRQTVFPGGNGQTGQTMAVIVCKMWAGVISEGGVNGSGNEQERGTGDRGHE